MSERSCSVPGCDRKYRCSGYCGLHYDRWRTRGTTDEPPPRPTECSVGGCPDKVVGWGWCRKHYYRWKKTGSLADPQPRTDISYTGAHFRSSRRAAMPESTPALTAGSKPTSGRTSMTIRISLSMVWAARTASLPTTTCRGVAIAIVGRTRDAEGPCALSRHAIIEPKAAVCATSITNEHRRRAFERLRRQVDGRPDRILTRTSRRG